MERDHTLIFVHIFKKSESIKDINLLKMLMTIDSILRACVLNHIQLFVTPWSVADQVPLALGFSRQEHWSGLPFSPTGDLINPGIKAECAASPALADGFFTTELPREPKTVLLKYNSCTIQFTNLECITQ